jgi:hypothetical protein
MKNPLTDFEKVAQNGLLQAPDAPLFLGQEAQKAQQNQASQAGESSQIPKNPFCFFNSNNYVYDHENMVFLFIDSEFDGNKYISLQVVGCFYLEDKFELFSFIVFNVEFEPFVKTHFSKTHF